MEIDLVSRLTNLKMSHIALLGTDGSWVDLSTLVGVSVVYAYPRTSPPDSAPIEGWDKIPGARGCTLQTREFADHYQDLLSAGADRVFGLSTQDRDYQSEMKGRLHVPFEILSDADLALTGALGLPTFQADGMILLKRLTIIVRDGWIEKVLYPISLPAENPLEVLTYLRNRTVPGLSMASVTS